MQSLRIPYQPRCILPGVAFPVVVPGQIWEGTLKGHPFRVHRVVTNTQSQAQCYALVRRLGSYAPARPNALWRYCQVIDRGFHLLKDAAPPTRLDGGVYWLPAEGRRKRRLGEARWVIDDAEGPAVVFMVWASLTASERPEYHSQRDARKYERTPWQSLAQALVATGEGCQGGEVRVEGCPGEADSSGEVPRPATTQCAPATDSPDTSKARRQKASSKASASSGRKGGGHQLPTD